MDLVAEVVNVLRREAQLNAEVQWLRAEVQRLRGVEMQAQQLRWEVETLKMAVADAGGRTTPTLSE